MHGLKQLSRFLLMLLLVVLYLLIRPASVQVRKWLESPRTIRFSLPLSPDIEKKYGVRSADLLVEKVVVAGFFSDWSPVDDRYRMEERKPGKWELKIAFPSGDNQYKFVVYVTNMPGVPLWTQDAENPRRVDDSFGGFNSVLRVPDTEWITLMLQVMVLALLVMAILLTLMEPLLGKLMRVRMRFRYKLALSVLLVGITADIFFVVYNVSELRNQAKQGVIETASLLHHYLVSSGIRPDELDDSAVARTAGETVQKLIWKSRVRGENNNGSVIQGMLSDFVIFSPDFRPLAWASREENRTIPESTAKSLGIDVPAYFREVVFGKAVDLALRQGESVRPVFADADGRYAAYFNNRFEAAVLGFRVLLMPVRGPVGSTIAWYGLLIHPAVYGSEIVRAAAMNLLIAVILIFYGLVLLLFIGRFVTASLTSLTDWTREILDGDYRSVRKIDTGDEFAVLADNFDRMRKSLGSRIQSLQLILQSTTQFQRMPQQQDLIQLLVMLLALPAGFGMGRTAFFMRDGFFLKGYYATGFLSVEEREQALRGLTGGLKQLFEEFREWRNRFQNDYHQRIVSISADASDNTVLWSCLNQHRPMLVNAKTYPFSMRDREIWKKAGIRDALVFPVNLNREPFGVILIDNALDGEPFPEDAIREFQLLLNFFEVNLQNAHFVEQLEDTVRDRTRELEGERNRLEARYLAMEGELRMARHIQQKLIPARPPNRHIATAYLPMQVIGGDFYDFLQYRNSDKLGIFLSDVSGHGVPAALITSMLKSFLQQGGPLRERPAEMLMQLNQMISEQTDGNFVTAFYGIYDPKEFSFIWANAGHNPPFLMRGERVESLTTEGSGMPLSVVDNMELYRLKKNYVENSIRLEEGDRLLLYTDGLVETVHVYDRSADFETRELPDVLRAIASLAPGEFIESLLEKLRRFRGSDDFEDDICLICMEPYGKNER
jgi:serine phosphatase RsbU (regulator of sigma subunit)/HAMP domain-containing protein